MSIEFLRELRRCVRGLDAAIERELDREARQAAIEDPPAEKIPVDREHKIIKMKRA